MKTNAADYVPTVSPPIFLARRPGGGVTELRTHELQRSRMTTGLIQLTNQPKTVAAATVISAAPTAESGTRVTREVVPRPTPQNTGRAGRWSRWIFFRRLFIVILFIVIVAPFKNIAMHVVQPKCVGLF